MKWSYDEKKKHWIKSEGCAVELGRRTEVWCCYPNEATTKPGDCIGYIYRDRSLWMPVGIQTMRSVTRATASGERFEYRPINGPRTELHSQRSRTAAMSAIENWESDA